MQASCGRSKLRILLAERVLKDREQPPQLAGVESEIDRSEYAKGGQGSMKLDKDEAGQIGAGK
jgi:hypothetical protein